MTEDRRQRTDDREQMTEDGRRRTDDRGQKYRKSEFGPGVIPKERDYAAARIRKVEKKKVRKADFFDCGF